MSSDAGTAIRVANLSKRYEIYAQPQDRLKQAVFTAFQRFTGLEEKRYFREFWALHDISFRVGRGETVGIVGKNGAGKSTLLHLIVGTHAPTAGSIEINGRVTALLELGSGFGYSAAWWLRGMPPDGTVVLTDLDPDLVARGTAHLERLGHRGRFRYAVGEAIETLRRAHGPFDVVYCDVDKEGYPDVVEPAVERLRPGGLLVTDNASPPNSRADEVGAASCARAWRGARRRFDARRHASSAPRRGARTRGRRVRRAPGRNPRAPTGA